MTVQETTAMAGWKLVPVEPTVEMQNAAIDVDNFKLGDISPLGFRESPQLLFARCYRAMLAAAPPPATSSAGEALREAIEFAEQDYHALTPAGEEMVDRWRAALQAGTEVAVKAAGDVLITEGFPKGWFIQDRRGEGVAILCGPTLQWPGSVAVCLRPKLMETSAWVSTAKAIAEALAAPLQQAGVESELVERLRTLAAQIDPMLLGGPDARLLNEAAASLSQLQQRIAEVEAAFAKLCEALGIQASKMAYLEAAAVKAALAASDAKLAEAVEKMERADEGLANAYSATYNDYDRDRLACERIGLQKGIAILRSSSIQEKG